MAFNLGRFATGLAQGGLQTYQTLSEIEQRKKEQELRQQQFELQRETAAREAADWQQKQEAAGILKEAYANRPTQGTGQALSDVVGALPTESTMAGPKANGTTMSPEDQNKFLQALSSMSPEERNATLQQYAPAFKGGMPAAGGAPGEVPKAALNLSKVGTYQDTSGKLYATDQTTAPTTEETALRYAQLAGEKGNPLALEKALAFQATHAQLKASNQAFELGEQTKTKNQKAIELSDFEIDKQKREQTNFKKWDKTVDDHNERFDVIKKLQGSNNAKEVFDAIQKDVTATVPGSKITLDEKKNVILYTAPGAKKPIELTPSQALDKVGAALLEDLGHSALRSFSSPEKMLDAINKKAEIDAKTMDANTHRMFYGPNGVYQQVHNAATSAKNAAGGDKSIKAKAKETASAMVEANITNPVTKKPYTQDEAYQYALRIQLHDPNMKAPQEWKLSTDNQTRSTADGTIVQDWNQATNSWNTRGLPAVSENASKIGVTADMSKDGRVGFKGKDGVYSSEREAVESFSPKAAIPMNKGTSGSHSPTDIYKQPPKQDEKALRDEWADLKMRQQLVGGSPEAKAKGALRMREIEQTLNGAPQSNRFIKTN